MNQVGTYNFVDVIRRRVFYTGTATLAAGQALCYQDDPSPTSPDRVKGFPFDVQTPDAGNAKVFAGIVADTSVGRTGPCYIDIDVPRRGDILKVKVGRGANIAVGDVLRLNHVTGTVPSLSTLGAFEQLSAALVSSSDMSIPQQVTLVGFEPLVKALESVASTSASSQTALIWVKFL